MCAGMEQQPEELLTDQKSEHIFKPLILKLIAILLRGDPSGLGSNVTASRKPSLTHPLESITPFWCPFIKLKVVLEVAVRR